MNRNTKIMSFGAFQGFFDPFWGPGDATRVFPEKFFYSAQLDMKIELAAKFEKNLMDGYPAIVRTHARTDARTHATENNGPSPINRGTKIRATQYGPEITYSEIPNQY